ncbi:MAG: tetratricopeptide repeat protein [Alistipes onderdonkii]
MLRSLQAIAPGSICKKSTKAHYGLLYSLALDKTGQTIDSDSMLRPAVNYFLRKGTNRQKFLSWYCLGRMEYSANNYQKATESYLKALEYQDLIDDPYLIGVCNFVLGELNLKQNNYQRALFYYQEAYENYQAANKTKHQVSAKTAIAAVYYMRTITITRSGIIGKH